MHGGLHHGLRDVGILSGGLLRRGFDRIIGVGGDGTFNEIANGFFEDDAPLRTGAAMGVIPAGTNVSGANARPGDVVIISGTIGDHETAILVAREGLRLEQTIESDCAPLGEMVGRVLAAAPDVHVMRDPTRGGLGTTLNEVASRSGVRITIDESSLPMDPRVRSVCDILGFDPIYMANEGKMIAIAPEKATGSVLDAMRAHPLGVDAAVIGTVREGAGVSLRTVVGGERPIVMLEGVQLPRIC